MGMVSDRMTPAGLIKADEARCLAVDLGAGRGRIVLGEIAGGWWKLREVGRFRTARRIDANSGYQCWDIEEIVSQIEQNIARANQQATSLGVDSWGVDYVLLDEALNRVGVP